MLAIRNVTYLSRLFIKVYINYRKLVVVETRQTIARLFIQQAEGKSNKIAVSDGNDSLTYKEVNSITNQLANWLALHDISEGNIIALLMKPSIEVVLWLLAVNKAGGTYITLDSQLPENRIKNFLTNTMPKLIITDSSPNYNFDFACIASNDIFSSLGNYSSDFVAINNCETPLAIFYTSGSTGAPKGVVISQSSVINLVESLHGLHDNLEVFAQFNNLAFDPSILEIWGTLLTGKTLVIVPYTAKQDAQVLKTVLKKNRVDAIVFPTSYFHQLISTFPDTVDSVKLIHFGGEQVNCHLVNKFLVYRKLLNLPVRLVNNYGPTEATAVTCRNIIESTSTYDDIYLSSIGRPIQNVQLYILDENMREVAEDEVGELYISGKNLANGYYNDDAQGNSKFIRNPYNSQPPFECLYRTGDLVKKSLNENFFYIGRIDDQVKINGFRVHLSEVEKYLIEHPAIDIATVLVNAVNNHKFLTAYIVLAESNSSISSEEIRNYLKAFLPDYMLPNRYCRINRIPLTGIGKVDKKALLEMQCEPMGKSVDMLTQKYNSIIDKLVSIWKKLLHQDVIDPNKNLFELGANSLKLAEACIAINQALGSKLLIAEIIANPTINKLAKFVQGIIEGSVIKDKQLKQLEIAVVGFACRFPKAETWQQFWQNLCEGIECLTDFNIEAKNSTLDSRKFIPRKGIIKDIDKFDADFFGISPEDANNMDPQQRIFLECAWQALEDSGNIPNNSNKVISIFAGQADSTYLQENLLKNNRFAAQNDWFQARLSTGMGALSTQVSYQLNLQGKSINLNTACSTGLVAIGQACQELTLGYSDIALAGCVSIDVSQRNGYYYQEGGIESADGKCSPFSSNASGTIFSDGAGIVVLKRLSDAIKDGDTIYSVIRGAGINNDGKDKLGYTAPGINGQIACIKDALTQAHISAEDVGYIETHGTATALGDVIEFSALNQAHRCYTAKNNYCTLGSVKANIGHTDIAAGIAGFIKACLCLYYKKLPPLINFSKANSEIDIDNSPFRINTTLQDWQTSEKRFAGVSAFGIGGTNAHMILEEYSQAQPANTRFNQKLFILSAKNKSSLEENVKEFVNYLNLATPDPNLLSDIAYTLQTGRDTFIHRKFAIGSSVDEIITSLNKNTSVVTPTNNKPNLVFMFSGQGSQYPNMCLQLAELIPSFASTLAKCNEITKDRFNLDVLALIKDNPDNALNNTQYTQIALFMVEYSLAKLYISLGVNPDAFIGHSIGEYVAACLAEVFSLENAIELVYNRGKLMATATTGKMLSIECSLEQFHELANGITLDLALHNSPQNCVASGSQEAIDKLCQLLDSKGLFEYRILHVSHAFHSYLMDSILDEFEALFNTIKLNKPQVPIISNLTGTWLTDEDAVNPKYWCKHLRQTVKFSDGINTLSNAGYNCFIEIGPGATLTAFTKDTLKKNGSKFIVINTLANHKMAVSDEHSLLAALGTLWQSTNIRINWPALYAEENRSHTPLPTYRFLKKRYWVEADLIKAPEQDISNWLYQLVWTSQINYELFNNLSEAIENYSWIVFSGDNNLDGSLIDILRGKQAEIISFNLDEKFIIDGKKSYITFFEKIQKQLSKPLIILYLASYGVSNNTLLTNSQIEAGLDICFYSPLYIIQAFSEVFGNEQNLKFAIVASGTQRVNGSEAICPVKASITGICRVIPREYPAIQVQLIDILPEENEIYNLPAVVVNQCLQEWENDAITAFRNGYQWLPGYAKLTKSGPVNHLKDNGVYFLTGGLGGISLTLCDKIARTVKNPVFVLLSRREMPKQATWEDILKDNSQQKIHSKIKMLQRLVSSGAILDFAIADVANLASIQLIIDKVIAKYGRINGLIHAAGIAGGGITQLKTREQASQVFSAKIQGTYALATALKNYQLDFVALCSSISAIVGELGQVDYCGANACLDAFAVSRIFNAKFITSINWNTWEVIGMAVDTKRPDDITLMDKGNTILPQQGQELFMRIMHSFYPQVIISSYDPAVYSLKDENFSYENRLDTSQPDEPAELERDNFIAPSNEIEKSIAAIWQDILGIKLISADDDFFELGGHSLKALKLLRSVNNQWSCKLTLAQLYESRTLQKLAAFIASQIGNNTDDNILIQLYQPKTTQDSNQNIFLFHPVSGNIFCYKAFVENYNSDLSIYGLQDPSIITGKLEFNSILEFAEAYLAQIRQVQPQGPYILVGYSFGGTVAYEVANLLLNQGEKIKLLVLIDSWAVFSEKQYDELEFKQTIKHYNKELSLQEINLCWQRMKLLVNHTPSKINQDLLLFKAARLLEEYKIINDQYNHWQVYNSGNIMVYPIDADHETIIYPENNQIIIQELKNYTILLNNEL